MTTESEGQSSGQTVSENRPAHTKLKEWLSQFGPIVAATSVALVFCLIIGSLFWPFLFNHDGGTLLRELSNFEVARGLITFLVAVTTVGIALILTVYVVVTLESGADKKFALGKEVLTGLIGVLGTIVGFYFGSNTSGAPQPSPPPQQQVVMLKEFKIDPAEIKAGDSFNISATTGGVKGEVEYVMTFKPDTVSKEVVGVMSNPDFKTSIKTPTGTTPGSVEVLLKFRNKKDGTPVETSGASPKAVVKVIQ